MPKLGNTKGCASLKSKPARFKKYRYAKSTPSKGKGKGGKP